ncbi:MAG: hypothetical protein A2287_06930 [Candidatus Melainabacteria bacterium RIFOXYA12_FULL_32_12]|nr:MAG: hypothetical protein A2287_06930 [Candidatus Melainabacteria bacterium RIFOXYA12_FULL_32_12]
MVSLNSLNHVSFKSNSSQNNQLQARVPQLKLREPIENDVYTPSFKGGFVDNIKKMFSVNRINKEGNTALISAILENDNNKIEKLIKRDDIDVNIQNSTGDTALMYSVVIDRKELVNKLLEKGADTNLKNKHGETALILASIFDRKEIAKTLLENKADVNIEDENGKTAITHQDAKDETRQVILNFLKNKEEK